jgi:moderate conductance mechanosensitive channel
MHRLGGFFTHEAFIMRLRRIMSSAGLVLLIAWTFLLAWRPAEADGKRGAQPASGLTSAQAQRALDVLQDDKKRAELIDTLRAIAKTPPSTTSATPAATLSTGAQLLAQVSNWFGELSRQFAAAARTMSDLPTIWRGLVQLTRDPAARATLIRTAWKLALVIALAFATEWTVRRGIRRPLAAVQHHAPDHVPAGAADRQPEAIGSAPAGAARDWRHWQAMFAAAGRLTLRLPFVLARLALELMPIACFAAIGNLLLATDIGGEPASRVVILAIVHAYVLCRGILRVTAAAISPASSQPSLFAIRDETAAYLGVWWTRIVIVTIFGVALANIALLLGLPQPAYAGMVRLVLLMVHLFVAVIILQCRRSVAALIRAPEGERGPAAVMRNRFADVWHIAAIVVVFALWVAWALQVQNGYALMLRYVLGTFAIVAIARLASIALASALERLFRISPELLQQFPNLAARANRYLPALRATLCGLITFIAVIALLEIWGIDATEWFAEGRIGARVASGVLTIAVAGVIALAIWEATNAAIEQHLAQLARERRYARAARLRTFMPMLRTTLLSIIATILALTTLSELGVNIAPLLAGAGIVGIAVGFGSQKLVQDVITGLFLLLENAVQVGDTVTVSGLSGVVENLSIRTVRLRAGDGSIHIIPFSSVTSVTNTNRGIGNAAVSVNVAFKEDTDRVGGVLKDIVAEMRREPAFKPMIRSDLDLWGVDRVDAAMATVVGQIECTDTGRWPVQREFYRRMKKRFQQLGIEIARPAQTTVVVRTEPTQVRDSAPDESDRRAAGGQSRRR